MQHPDSAERRAFNLEGRLMASLAEWLKTLTPEQNQFVARLVASLPESEGGLNMPLQNTAHVAVLNPSKIR